MSDMEEDEDYGFEYETDDEEEEDVAIENQVCFSISHSIQRSLQSVSIAKLLVNKA